MSLFRHTPRLDARTRKALARFPGDLHKRMVRKGEALEDNSRSFGFDGLEGSEADLGSLLAAIVIMADPASEGQAKA